jgi:hypothetical protein
VLSEAVPRDAGDRLQKDWDAIRNTCYPDFSSGTSADHCCKAVRAAIDEVDKVDERLSLAARDPSEWQISR